MASYSSCGRPSPASLVVYHSVAAAAFDSILVLAVGLQKAKAGLVKELERVLLVSRALLSWGRLETRPLLPRGGLLAANPFYPCCTACC